MSRAAFDFAGVPLVATAAGALWWPREAALLVADLHLEKGTSFGRRGTFLPPYDSRATLDRLAALVTALSPRRVLCLGDSFHDSDGPDRLPAEDAGRLRALTQGREWLWIAGNHDPAATAAVGGAVVAEAALGPLICRHQAVGMPAAGEVSGHFHPKASLSIAGKRVSCRCFVADSHRLILPAFGAYAGGLDVFDPAIATLLAPAFTVYLLGRDRIHTLPSRRLLCRNPDKNVFLYNSGN